MYVCICNAVTDKQIQREIDNGATSMRDLSRSLGVATCCGVCGMCARSMLRDAGEQTDALASGPA
ncbi:MAG: (2Fe-2S)-binding protein [Gammaproteobacteria bacterium]|jgi:bacterioferritin-associated ferredoxin|nr:(2Fe-2S)-binding protein [Gammaproteobacteria bacterium]